MVYELFNFYLWIGNIRTLPCFSTEAQLYWAGPVITEVPPALIARHGSKIKLKQTKHTCETRKKMIVEASCSLFS